MNPQSVRGRTHHLPAGAARSAKKWGWTVAAGRRCPMTAADAQIDAAFGFGPYSLVSGWLSFTAK